MKPQIHHIGITVADLDRSVEFYGIFGLEEVMRMEMSGPEFEAGVDVPGGVVNLALLSGHNTVVELLQYATPSGGEFQLKNNDVGSAHVCFTVEDMEATVKELEAKGLSLNAPPSQEGEEGAGEGVRFAYLRDPDGITVEILQVGPATNLGALGVPSA